MSDRSGNRDRIRAIAVDLFQRNGYDATGMRELSEAVGLGAGALYHHIGSKEELLFGISIDLLRDALDEATAAIDGLEEPEDRLRALASHLVTQHADRQAAWSVALREGPALTEAHRSEVTAARDAYEALWSSVLAEGAARGTWRSVAPVELWGILGMFNSTARWFRPGGSESPLSIAGRYIDLLLGGLRAGAAVPHSDGGSDVTPEPGGGHAPASILRRPSARAGSVADAAPRGGGPLAGLKVVEFAGIGPVPMCGMLLADLGATVLRIDRREPSGLGIDRPLRYHYALRGRHAVSLDLKDPGGVETALELIESADALIEGFRPGVMERLGLGPQPVLARNPRLVYGRVTGWGQDGPLAHAAGHDINYLAITGVLDAIGRRGGPPTVPLNLVGDFAGGSLYLAVGLLAGIIRAHQDETGQVVDAAIVDGVSHLVTSIVGLVDAGQWNEARGTNILDGGAYFYDVYECSDGKWVSIGPIESKFLADLLARIGLHDKIAAGIDPSEWAAARAALAAVFLSRPRDEWSELLDGTDACFAPVLSFREARDHAHLRARATYVAVDGTVQPAPAPRFSRTPPPVPHPARGADDDVRAALAGWLGPERTDALCRQGVLRQA